MLNGAGRYSLREGRFQARGNLEAPGAARGVGHVRGRSPASAVETAAGLPANTTLQGFVKPLGMPMHVGLVAEGFQQQIITAREIFDNDHVAGAVAEILGGIPFGNCSLSGMPDDEHQEPYLRSMDHMRTRSLMPIVTVSHQVDGAFLGSGIFDASSRSWAAMVLQDLLHADVQPVPYFGATPVIDVTITPEMMRSISSTDPRMARYHRFLQANSIDHLQRLQPENTFYIPRRTMAHHAYGQSMFRRIMVLYALEKALARGTIEMSYRRQRPISHITVGDENWDPTIAELQDIGNLFNSADIDPLGATVVTRQGVQSQEVGGVGDMWRWTDNIDALTTAKLRGLGMPDGLLGGDTALDSVSATLTVFINMVRQLRDYVTRAFFYEKMFPYLAVINGHRRDHARGAPEHGHSNWGAARYYHAASADLDVDISQYVIPTITWHNSMRPEGDRDYLGLLQELTQIGVPVPLRIMANAGGLDIDDVLTGERDDIEVAARVAKYNERVGAINAAGQQAQQNFDGQTDQEFAGLMTALRGGAPRRRGLAAREFDDRYLPHTEVNGHRYVTTARERRRRMDAENRAIARHAALAAARENHRRRQTVRLDVAGPAPI